MKFLNLKQAIADNLFTLADVYKYFPEEKEESLRIQLSRFVKRGLIHRIKRGLYCFDLKKVNELQLANLLYTPSYVSAQSALHYYGIIPDIPQSITSVTTVTTKKILTKLGTYHYFKVATPLYFGFDRIKLHNSRYLKIARPEKALLDFIYLNKIKQLADLRVDLSKVNHDIYYQYSQHYPNWIQLIKLRSNSESIS